MPRKIQRYGWRPDVPDVRDYRYAAPRAVLAALPPSADLSSGCPPVYDQLTLGSCTANAINAAHQFEQIKQDVTKAFIPSRLFVYWNERDMEGSVNEDSGAEIRDGIKSVVNIGVCPETLWPYDTFRLTQKPPDQCYQDATDHQVVSYQRIEQNLDDMRACIADGYPFVFGFCFTGDTKVSLLDGKEVSFKDLSDNYFDKKFWVYSCDELGNIVPGLAHSPRKTGFKELVKIVLDNGETVRCTTSHRFLMRDGTYKEASLLVAGDSLMPLYRRTRSKQPMKGYEEVYNPCTKKWRFTHRISFAGAFGRYKLGMVVHHKDFNRKNNSPENLEIMTWEEHTNFHANHAGDSLKKMWADPEKRKLAIERSRELGRMVCRKRVKEGKNGFQCWTKERWIESSQKSATTRTGMKASLETVKKLRDGRRKKNKWQKAKCRNTMLRLRMENPEKYRIAQLKTTYNRFHRVEFSSFDEFVSSRETNQVQANNHKVVCVESDGWEDVYDITVEKYHNFALTCGVFVHNSVYDAFESKEVAASGELNMPQPGEGVCGGHAVMAVGYDDITQRFLVRNSWGEKWGKKGYFTIPYAYLLDSNLSADFWTIRMVEVSEHPEPEPQPFPPEPKPSPCDWSLLFPASKAFVDSAVNHADMSKKVGDGIPASIDRILEAGLRGLQEYLQRVGQVRTRRR